MVDYAIAQGWFSDQRAGRTPKQTMKAKLSVAIRREGDRSVFVRTAPGRFSLRALEIPERVYQATPYRPPPTREKVLVFPTVTLAPVWFQGIERNWPRILRRLEAPGICRVLARGSAEQTDDHKQLLTYVLVTRGEQVLGYKRGVYNRVEDMLKGAHCVGFGGHVRPDDFDLLAPDTLGIFGCARRELKEELTLPPVDQRRLDAGEGLQLVGLLNDDSSDVGRRHLAAVFQFEVSDDPAWNAPKRGEKSITQLHWITPGTGVRCWEFEYWSQLCLREFRPALIESAPTYTIRRMAPLRPPHLLCIAGEIGSGKTETSHVLARDFNYGEVNSGQVLAALLAIPPIPVTPRAAFQTLAFDFISSEDGPAQLATAILERAQASGKGRLLVDGIRQRRTLEALRLLAGRDLRTAVLFVHTTADRAYDLYQRREGKVPFSDFVALREAPVELEVPSLIDLSDAVLYNWTERRDYRRMVRRLMREVGVTRRQAGTTSDGDLA
jgi:predicted NUDIX family phosphoesterase